LASVDQVEGYAMSEQPLGPLEQAPGLRIGEIAKRSGVSVKTIRFYCDQGLLQPAGRSEGGYRLFSQESIAELAIIRGLRTMDVPIAELGRILEVRRSGLCNCSILKESIGAKMASIDERIDELAAMKLELGRLLDRWHDCGGKQPEASS
jgi:MerR family copper efflux transcriptional regulator